MASTVLTLSDAAMRAENRVARFSGLAARLSVVALAISLAVGLAAGIGTRFHLWDFRFGLLGLFPYCLYAGIAAFSLGLAWALAAALSQSGTGARYGAIGLAGSVAVLWVPLQDIYQVEVAHAIPPIHDISTDTEHPPLFVALKDRRAGATNPPGYDGLRPVRFQGQIYTTETLQKLYDGDIKPYSQLGTTPAKLFVRALRAARAMGWRIVAVAPDPEGGRIEATDRTLLFGFTDDIVIRVEPAGIGARLDIRSKSRVGTSDIGANAARIRAYLKTLASA